MYGDIDEVKKILKSLLVAVPGGMSVNHLERDFHDMEGRHIPYKEFSFDSIIEFFNSIPETLRVSIRNKMIWTFTLL